MMKWIRWQGLIAFLVVLGLVLVFWLLLLDPLVEWAVERTGTAIVGARVDLDAVDVSLSPLGVTLSRLQVTDPEQPMQNSLEVKRIAFALDGLNLLRRKVIIQEMTADGIRFGTARTSSGAVAKAPKRPEPQTKDSVELPTFEIPDVKTVLAKEELGTLRLADTLETDLKGADAKWKAQTASIPDKAKMDGYRKRIDQLKAARKRGGAALLQSAAEAGALASDIRKDLNRVKDLQHGVTAEMAAWKKRIEQVEKAPMEDAKRISAKYGLSTEGLRNMSALLFGRKINGWVSTGLQWYGRLQPMLERDTEKKQKTTVVKPLRGRGEDVRFREHAPRPDFLIFRIKASVQPSAGSFDGAIRNVTPDQNILGKPLTFAFSGTGLQNMKSMSLSGTLNHVVPARSDDHAAVRVQQYSLRNLPLTESDTLSVALERGLADCTIDTRIRGGKVSAVIDATLRSVQLSTSGTRSDKPVIASISRALSGVNSFTLTAKIDGTPEQYDVDISSNLDRVLQQAVGSFAREQGDRFQAKLRAAIAERTADRIKGLKGSLSGLTDLGKDLNSSGSSLDSLLNEATSAGKTGGIKLPF